MATPSGFGRQRTSSIYYIRAVLHLNVENIHTYPPKKSKANASISSSGAHPPGQPRGICSNVSPGGGALAILSQPGGWALAWLLIQRSVNNEVLKKNITVVHF